MSWTKIVEDHKASLLQERSDREPTVEYEGAIYRQRLYKKGDKLEPGAIWVSEDMKYTCSTYLKPGIPFVMDSDCFYHLDE